MSVPTIENLNILLRYLERDYTLDDLTCRGSLLGPSRRSFIEEVIARQIYDEGRSGRLLTADFLLAGAQPSQLSFLEDRYARGLIVHSGNVFRDCRVVLQVHTAAITSQVSGLEKGLLSEVLSNHMARGIDTDHMVCSSKVRYSTLSGCRRAEMQVKFDHGIPAPSILLSHMANLFTRTNIKGRITGIKLVAQFDFLSPVYNRDTSILEFKADWEGSPVCDPMENKNLLFYVLKSCTGIRDFLFQERRFTTNFRLLQNMDLSLDQLVCPCNGPVPCLGFQGATLCTNPLENPNNNPGFNM